MSALLLPLFLLTGARADDVLPSYEDEVVVAAWTELDTAITASCTWPRGSRGVGVPLRCDPDDLQAVIERLRAFLAHVSDDARVHYLIGLAERHRGELRRAERAFEAAVRRNPDRPEAWFDLGELRAARGDWAGAREAFTHVVRVVPPGPQAWPAHLHLAQVAGHQRDADAFEAHLEQALRFGFTFRMVEGQVAWRAFYADPRLHDTLHRLLLVYADPQVRESLAAE